MMIAHNMHFIYMYVHLHLMKYTSMHMTKINELMCMNGTRNMSSDVHVEYIHVCTGIC